MVHALERTVLPIRLSSFSGLLILVSGAGGMAISFAFLASSQNADVIAGAAGFVAGSILVAAGQLSVTLHDRPIGLSLRVRERTVERSPLAVERWICHFRRNKLNRIEPQWTTPISLSPAIVRPLVRSLEQFQLGDGGGPAYLIARDRERFLSRCSGARTLVNLWFAEEREHSRLLGEAVARFGGHCIERHWSFSAFCFTRKWFGVRFELTVLLLTEIVSTVYYRLLRRYCDDDAVRSMCALILRDEAGHVAFHRDRLARAARNPGIYGRRLWTFTFRMLGVAAGTMLWVNHARCLRAVGATTAEFYREVWKEESRFLLRLQRETLGVRELPD
jgi:hypothetical protein